MRHLMEKVKRRVPNSMTQQFALLAVRERESERDVLGVESRAAPGMAIIRAREILLRSCLPATDLFLSVRSRELNSYGLIRP